jgi:hydroxyethylthiazole kinase-like uncharacterized protein yjeF
MKILTARQMGEVDGLTTARYGIPSLLLMENAGHAVAGELERACPRLRDKKILILCGTGNNGGDGLVVARHLVSRGIRPEIWILGDDARYRGDAMENWRMIQSLGLTIRNLPDDASRAEALAGTPRPDVILDAIFGTGLSKPLGREFEKTIEWVNASRPPAMVVSVDLPSGVFADDPEGKGISIQADLTVTFTSLKAALVFPPASERAGRVVVAAIGSPATLLENPEYSVELIDPCQVRRALPRRARNSHKGTFGHVFILAGSRDKSGAALMTGMSALRSGAGLVTLMLPESLRKNVVGKIPELMTCWLPETREGTPDRSALKTVLDQLSQADAVVIGPGISTNQSTQKLVRDLVCACPVPAVLDADGINAFAGERGGIRNEAKQPVVITPHPGEMGRLLGVTILEIQRRRMESAREYAVSRNVFAVLKGNQTLIATPGGRIFVNDTGNPGMATAGTGDVLAGMMGRFLAGWQRKRAGSDFESLADFLCAAVYLHGSAGDLAAADLGEESLVATDLIAHLPAAFKEIARR